MQNFLNANNCWCKQNLETFQRELTFTFDALLESLFGFVSYLVF